MAELRWTDESAQWLQDIYEYISANIQKLLKKSYLQYIKKPRC
jgi:hypothetical protein